MFIYCAEDLCLRAKLRFYKIMSSRFTWSCIHSLIPGSLNKFLLLEKCIKFKLVKEG